MTNLIEAAKQQIWDLMHAAYDKAAAAGTLPAGQTLKGAVEIPKDTVYGDYACGCAMAAARDMRMAPRKIAEALVEQIDLNGTYFRECTIAGAGFINFRVSDAWYADLLKGIEADGADYGRINDGKGEKVMVEFVSANPTGPMTIGNARGGVLGDTLATVLDFAGYNVWREFYVNDAGNQIDLFGKSIEARYLQLLYGEENVEFPDNGYHGDDIR
ncbi:MAG: arginine--tRNA ligase, partial [Oscillospiraceae bacterium]|nr:arginine--tRNA ligase [Oscillospiraceae bacterium]